MIRTNPKYDNICWTRVGTYRNNACVECSKKEECDSLYSNVTGRFSFEKAVSIPHNSTRPQDRKLKIRDRAIPLADWELHSDIIKHHVDSLISDGALYSDDLVKSTKLHREVLTTWLKHNGFTKRTKHAKRWENHEYTKL